MNKLTQNSSSEIITLVRSPPIFCRNKEIEIPISPTNSSESVSTKVATYISTKKLNREETSSSTEDLNSMRNSPMYFQRSMEIIEVSEIEEVTETQQDMERDWAIMDEAQELSLTGQWQRAHEVLLGIQNPFWRDAGYSLCAKLTANAAIDAKTKESADISFSFCNLISNTVQKEKSIELVETMLHCGQKASLGDADTFCLQPDRHPFRKAKAFALAGYWKGAYLSLSQLPDSFLKDRGYTTLAKMAAEIAQANQNKELAKESYRFCREISDIKEKTQVEKLIKTMLGNGMESDLQTEELALNATERLLGSQASSIASAYLLHQSEQLASIGLWQEAQICVAKMRPPQRDQGYRMLASIAAQNPAQNTRIAYLFCNQIVNKTTRNQTKEEIHSLVGWRRWLHSIACL